MMSKGDSGSWVRTSSPPDRGGFADDSSKQPCEVCLIREAALNRDLAEGRVCRQHEPLSPLDATPDDVLVRGIANTVAERNIEVKFAQASDGCEILVSDRLIQVGVDVGENPPDLPRRKTLPRGDGGGRRSLPFHCFEHCSRASQTFRGAAAFVGQSLAQCPEKLGDGRAQSTKRNQRGIAGGLRVIGHGQSGSGHIRHVVHQIC